MFFATTLPYLVHAAKKESWEVEYMPSVNLIKTGARIEELRKASGISVKELQEIFGFNSPQAIYKWQNGLCLPTVNNLVVLALLFNTTIDKILVVS